MLEQIPLSTESVDQVAQEISEILRRKIPPKELKEGNCYYCIAYRRSFSSFGQLGFSRFTKVLKRNLLKASKTYLWFEDISRQTISKIQNVDYVSQEDGERAIVLLDFVVRYEQLLSNTEALMAEALTQGGRKLKALPPEKLQIIFEALGGNGNA